jgi:hypothetical protein
MHDLVAIPVICLGLVLILLCVLLDAGIGRGVLREWRKDRWISR